METGRQKLIDWLTLVVSALVLLSAAAAILAGALSSPRPIFMLGFEVVILISGAFGVLVGRGRFGDGPAIALLCVAGAVAVGSLLGDLCAGKRIGTFDLRPLLFARCAAAAVLALLAGVIVLRRDPAHSIRALLRGIVFGVLFIGLVGGLYAVRAQVFAHGPLAKAGMVIVGGVVGLGLLAATVHYTIKAFAPRSELRAVQNAGK